MERKNLKTNNISKGEIVIYHTKDGKAKLDVKLDKKTVWLNAHQMASIFDVKRPAIVKHVNNIYKTKELNRNSTCSILEQVAADGKSRRMNLYNLDMIISVGYRVNSKRATEFRVWATQVLKKYIIDGLPTLSSGTPTIDTDHDGMPDNWEDSNGLNKNDPNDNSLDKDGDGYTNIEEYLNSLVN
ncbi:MAG: RhuM family protein [Patescibacteria group bacterium]